MIIDTPEQGSRIAVISAFLVVDRHKRAIGSSLMIYHMLDLVNPLAISFNLAKVGLGRSSASSGRFFRKSYAVCLRFDRIGFAQASVPTHICARGLSDILNAIYEAMKKNCRP